MVHFIVTKAVESCQVYIHKWCPKFKMFFVLARKTLNTVLLETGKKGMQNTDANICYWQLFDLESHKEGQGQIIFRETLSVSSSKLLYNNSNNDIRISQHWSYVPQDIAVQILWMKFANKSKKSFYLWILCLPRWRIVQLMLASMPKLQWRSTCSEYILQNTTKSDG